MHKAIQRAALIAIMSALGITQLACPPGVIDLVANTSRTPIRATVKWGAAVVRTNPEAEPSSCPRAFFWLVPVSAIESGRVPRRLAKLRPATVTYDEAECSATVTIPPGMAAAAGDPKGFTNARISFADRITVQQGQRTQDFVLGAYAFKYEFDYGAPRLNVWRVNLEQGRDAA